MAKTKADKVAIVSKLEEGIKDAASAVFVHFNKLNVADETNMRRALRADGISYVVAKKTLIRRALGNLGHQTDGLTLDGEVAVAYGGGEDTTLAARLMHEFGKKFADKVAILGGVFEGKIASKGDMQAIALIPSIQTLYGMFAQVVNSPRSRFAVVLNAVAEKKGQTA